MSKEVRPYIVLAAQEWQLNLGSNARNLAIEFSKTAPVLYVNPAIDINTIRKEFKNTHGRSRIKRAIGLENSLIKAANNLWVYTPSMIGLSVNWLHNEKLFNRLNKYNARRYFESLLKAINSLQWKEENCIVFNDSMMFNGMHIQDFFRSRLNFYYIRDNLVEHPYYQRHGSRVEAVTIKNADAVFANSAYLADYAKTQNKLSFDIGQGCELDIYDPNKNYQIPEDISSVPNPRIGYVGFLTGERLDISLLEQIAAKRKDWQLVLIGPEEIMFRQSKLHEMENVHFLGAKKADELPAYLKYIDVCINPQLVNPLTVGNYPRKIDEYLAMGKATVATDTPAMKMFLPYVHLAIGVEKYVAAIETALKPVSQESVAAAISFAKSHTWQSCVDKIYSTQNELLDA
jgi:teichuronic acid biosynthesis glycosyltransferase TuaH